MRLGSGYTAVKVGDATFWCDLTWGEIKRVKAEIDALTDETQMEFLTSTMIDLVQRVDNLTLPDGTQATALDQVVTVKQKRKGKVVEVKAKVADILPIEAILEFFAAAFAVGSKLGPSEGPAAVPLASEPPSAK